MINKSPFQEVKEALEKLTVVSIRTNDHALQLGLNFVELRMVADESLEVLNNLKQEDFHEES